MKNCVKSRPECGGHTKSAAMKVRREVRELDFLWPFKARACPNLMVSGGGETTHTDREKEDCAVGPAGSTDIREACLHRRQKSLSQPP